MTDLSNWMDTFRDKLDQKTNQLIFEPLPPNQFTSKLQLKLLTSDQVDMMFSKELSLLLGAKSLLMYQLDFLKKKSPQPMRGKREMQSKVETRRVSLHVLWPVFDRTFWFVLDFSYKTLLTYLNSFPFQCVLPALQEQGNKVKGQLDRKKQEYREIEL